MGLTLSDFLLGKVKPANWMLSLPQSKRLLQLNCCFLAPYACHTEGRSGTVWNIIITQNLKHCPPTMNLIIFPKPMNGVIPSCPAFLCDAQAKMTFTMLFMKSLKSPGG